MSKHTPGPWITDDRHIHPASGLTYPRGQEPETDVIVLVDTDQHADGLLNETDKANLRLIAAAPEIFEALRRAERAMTAALAPEKHHLPMAKAIADARALLAKIEGQP